MSQNLATEELSYVVQREVAPVMAGDPEAEVASGIGFMGTQLASAIRAQFYAVADVTAWDAEDMVYVESSNTAWNTEDGRPAGTKA